MMAQYQRPIANGHRPNAATYGDLDVPPSTMAAQLISDISTATKTAHPAERDDLQRLISEISEMESQMTEISNDAPGLQHAHKLLYVFSRTVLERLCLDDPFLKRTQLLEQASDALDVFAVTIKETPEVLEYTLSDDESLQTRGQEPMWMWLFPRILPLLGRDGCESLAEKVKDFLFTLFQILFKSPRVWTLSSSFFAYLRRCAATLLTKLQDVAGISDRSFRESLVPASDVDLTSLIQWEYTELGLSSALKYRLTDSLHCFRHVTNLLSLLLDISIGALSSRDTTYAFQDHLPWVLDSIGCLHELHKRRRESPALPQWNNFLEEELFSAVHSLIMSMKLLPSLPTRRKAYITLAMLAIDLLQRPSELSNDSLHITICSTLLQLALAVRNDEVLRRTISSSIGPVLRTILGGSDIANLLGDDFEKAAFLFCEACQINPSPSRKLSGANPVTFSSSLLDSEFQQLSLQTPKMLDRLDDDTPPSKRRKLSENTGILDTIMSKLYLVLGKQAASDLRGLHQVAGDCFSSLDETHRGTVITYLGLIPCAASGTLTIGSDHEDLSKHAECSICDYGAYARHPDGSELAVQDVLHEATLILEKIVKSTPFVELRQPRILAMFTLRRLASHANVPELLDLGISYLGQWCLRSLKSSMRELRIASGRTIPLFCKENASTAPIIRRNRLLAMEALHELREQDVVFNQEACVLAWGQLGRLLNDSTLVFVLLELIKFLGHTNPVITSVAFNEMLSLAKARNNTVQQMCEPFWDIIAYDAVKDLLSRPHTTQYMAELLDTSVTGFLLLTQDQSLPYLILNKNYEVIKRISQARGDHLPWLVIFEPDNLVKILALLLQQSTPDVETFIMSLLIGYDDEFKKNDFTELMRIEPASTAFYLLMATGEADDTMKSRIRLALQILASHAPGIEDTRKKNKVGAFLEQHILGLASRLIDIIMAVRTPFSMIERQRAIKAVEELIKVAKSHSRIARPQLCSCLQSAIATSEFQLTAYSAWDAMLRELDDDDVGAMLESTFSIAIQHWPKFDEDMRTMVQSTLNYLLSSRKRLIRASALHLPSLSRCDGLEDIEAEFRQFKTATDPSSNLHVFEKRLRHENSGVVHQALVELKDYLHLHQSFLQASSVSEQPDPVIGSLVRSILDTCIKFSRLHANIANLSAECIGLIGCLDPNRVESIREQRDMIVVTNFKESGESTDFVLFMLQYILVPAFLSTTDTMLQGFFSFSMQQLLEVCDFRRVCGATIRSGQRDSQEPLYRKWQELPVNVQHTLAPFLTSKYSLAELKRAKVEYPIFTPISCRSDRGEPVDKLYGAWLRTFVADLLSKPSTLHAGIIFPAMSRAIRIRDTTVANFLLPYLALHVVLEGSDENRDQIKEELRSVLQYEMPANAKTLRKEEWRSCLEAVFRVLDYFSRWIQERQLKNNQNRGSGDWVAEVELVRSVTTSIPAEILSQAAIECRSYSRALFYWEQHIRNERSRGIEDDRDHKLLERLQDIYSQIDEPDGIEGISAQLHVLDIEQQIIGHQKAGRWTAAQTWYEIKLAERPDDADIQVNLLNCLKESGQHDVLLNYVEGMQTSAPTVSRLLPYAIEASWATNRWPALDKYISMAPDESRDDFNFNIGQALFALHQQKGETERFTSIVRSIREKIACALSAPMTASLAACHDTMLKLHVLTELEMIAGTDGENSVERAEIVQSLNRRIEVIGAYLNDKQYVLGIRRAAMKLSRLDFTEEDIAEAWLTSARLARKGNAMHQSFNAVLHASQLGDSSATIEHARLIWKEGNHRKAIGILEGSVKSNAFVSYNKSFQSTTFTTDVDQSGEQNMLKARAILMLAKWQDVAGQTNSTSLRHQYQQAARTHTSWEKGHYYLGRHYNKLLESERLLPTEQQKESYITGEAAKLVIENYLRALSYGTKYLYQTLPRILTLWLDLGSQVNQPLDAKAGYSKEFANRINGFRKQHLDQLHARFGKYVARIPAYMFYTTLPQILSRIAHPNPDVFKVLQNMIVKVVSSFPQHTLWNLLAVCTSNQADRKNRGMTILQFLQKKPDKKGEGEMDIKTMIKHGFKLTGELIPACNSGEFPNNRTTFGSLKNDLGFHSKNCTPNPLAVPFESILTATLPTLTDNLKNHKAFSNEVVTIQSFHDSVMILSSLQKPRKLTAIGSDGRNYGLMCKPKDDLRKDQRLMEFNSMINRALKRDTEASRRQLYIKTYAVTPLNEECGLIEWVDGLKTLRDILLGLYKTIGISIQYKEIEFWCEKAIGPDKNIQLFQDQVLAKYPPVFYKWFVQQFPEPSTWFAARIRYTRSCAVMSMVGTILGLGDRHGENILFEEGNGGTFHVDFNCLFDKGLTFTKPERVPFRLTHNMTDAMGLYNYEGPFRKSAELTLKLLRQHEETLMTILEAFVYDPTLDLLVKKPEKKKREGVPQTAQGVLDSIQRKVKGFLAGETVPLGVEGQVQELIKQATDLEYLASMYIGWCSFL